MALSLTHPSNIFKHCPKCGQSGFKFDKNNSFDCPSCGFKYYINAASAVAVILELSDGRVLLARRKFDPASGMLDLPGGFVDIGERAEDAAKREVFEELGIKIDSLYFLASFPNEYQFKGITYYTCDLAFVAKVDSNINPIPADDVSEIIPVKPSEIDFDKIGFASIKNILREYMITKSK